MGQSPRRGHVLTQGSLRDPWLQPSVSSFVKWKLSIGFFSLTVVKISTTGLGLPGADRGTLPAGLQTWVDSPHLWISTLEAVAWLAL